MLVGDQQAATEIAALTTQLEASGEENRHLKKQLRRAEAIIDVQKNLGRFWDQQPKRRRLPKTEIVIQLVLIMGVHAARQRVGLSRATYYRCQQAVVERKKKRTSPTELGSLPGVVPVKVPILRERSSTRPASVP